MYSLVLMMALSNGAATPALHEGVDQPRVSHYGQNDHRQYRRRCHGCCGGGGSCHGCCGGWRGGCCGGGCCGGYSGGCHGCYGGGYGCSGGCSGGYMSGYGGGSMMGGYGSTGFYGDTYAGYTYPGTYGGYMSGYGNGNYMGGYVYPQTGAYMGDGYYQGGTTIQGTTTDTERPATGTDRRDRERGLDRSPQGPDRGTPDKSRDRDKDREVSIPTPARIVVSLPADAKLTVDGTPTTSTSSTRVFVSPALEPGQQYQYTFRAEVVRKGERQSATKQVVVRAGHESRVQFDLPATTVAQK
jgi:uncharacterized protein (TIGR03000 family)